MKFVNIRLLPQEALQVIETLNAHHFDAFFVGGCVRALLLGHEVHDYDITTNAQPAQVIEIFSNICKVLLTGIKHGTVTLCFAPMAIEVTTYRIETEYLDHRSPNKIAFTNELRLDLARRDFTINAMAFHPSLGIIDLFDGQTDLKEKRIRCVGDPEKRLEEDALRILRAVRFSVTLCFTIDPALQFAIQKKAALLTYLSKERIRDELNRILKSKQTRLLRMLDQLFILPYLFPQLVPLRLLKQETPWHLYDVFEHTDRALDHSIGAPLPQRLALLYHDCGKAYTKTMDANGIAHFKGHASISANIAESALKDLRYDKKMIRQVTSIIYYHDTYVNTTEVDIRRFLYGIAFDYALAYDIFAVQFADNCAKNPHKAQIKNENIKQILSILHEMEKKNIRYTLHELAINGSDLLALGFQGKEIKACLEAALLQVIEDPQKNTREQLLNYIQSNKKDI